MTFEPITREHIDELLAFLPGFEDVQRDCIVGWEPAWNPYPVYADDVDAFFRLLSMPMWMSRGYNIQEDGARLADDAFVATADLEQIRRMFTFCVRGERFSTGIWDNLLKEGRIAALLKRLQALRDTLPVG